MLSVVLSLPLSFVVLAYAKELQITPIDNTHDSMRKLVDKWINRIQDPLLPHHALENATLAKSGMMSVHVVIPSQRYKFLPLQPQPLFQNS